MRFSHRKGFVDRQSYVAQYIALVLLVMGVAGTLGMDDLLAAFAAGMGPLCHWNDVVIDCLNAQEAPLHGMAISRPRPRATCSLQ